MGLLSTADALLDRPMPQVLAELSLSAKIYTALSGAGGAFGNVYETLSTYEKADWNELSSIAKNSGYSEDAIPDCLRRRARGRPRSRVDHCRDEWNEKKAGDDRLQGAEA